MKSDELYTIGEVCSRLKVHERTVYRWLKAGRLKAFKAGKLWRIPAASLDVFLYGEAGPPPTRTTAVPTAEPAAPPVQKEVQLDTQMAQKVDSILGIPPASADPDCPADLPVGAGRHKDLKIAGDAGIVEEWRTVRIRYETLEGVIRYDEKNPSRFEVDLDHPVREMIIEHFTSERDFKTPASRHDDRHIERARPVDDPSYFSLALCTLHVSTGVRVDW